MPPLATQPATATTTEERKLPSQVRAMGAVKPGSIDAEARTVDVIWTTGADVPFMDLWSGEVYMERLATDEGAVRMGRFDAGVVPLLDVHDDSEVNRQFGIAERAWFEVIDGVRCGVASVRFSKRAAVEPVWQDVQDGILRGISVRYIVWRYVIERSSEGPDIMLAVDWEPIELSLATVPADAGGHVRSSASGDRVFPCVIERAVSSSQEPDMSQTTEPTVALERKRAQDILDAASLYGIDADTARAAVADGVEVETAKQQFRSALKERERADAQVDLVKVERERIGRIQRAARSLPTKVGEDFIESLIADGRGTADALDALIAESSRVATGARSKAVEERADKSTKVPIAGHVRTIEVGTEENEKYLDGMKQYMKCRALPAKYKMTEQASQFAHMRQVDLCRDYLERQGSTVRGRSAEAIVIDALRPIDGRRAALPIHERSLGGLHGLADFVDVVGGVTNDVLLDSYNEVGTPWRQIVTPIEVQDFGEKGVVRFGDAPDLLPVNEHGEYKSGTISTSKEGIAVEKQGRIIGITTEVILSDKWDVFGRIPAMFGKAAARNLRKRFFQLVIDGATILMKTDGLAVYNSTMGTLITGAGNTPDLTGLQAVRNKMRRQQNLAGEPMGVTPSFILVPDTYELALDQIVNGSADPADVSDRTPGYLRSMQAITSVELTANSTAAWYAFADPAELESIGFATLMGQEAVSLEQQVGFRVDGVENKVRLIAGFGWIDRRGAVKVVNA